MIKFVIAAIWIAAATVGSVYYSFGLARNTPAVESPASLLGGLDYVQTDIISVPVLRKGQVYGYFLGRLVYTVDPAEAKKLAVPVEPLLTDQVYTYLYGNPQIDFTKRDDADVDAFRNGLREAVNKRFGAEVVHDVLIQQFDFLTKDEIRDNQARRSATASEALSKLQNGSAPAAPKGAGH